MKNFRNMVKGQHKDYETRLALALARLPLEKRIKARQWYLDHAAKENQLSRIAEGS